MQSSVHDPPERHPSSPSHTSYTLSKLGVSIMLLPQLAHSPPDSSISEGDSQPLSPVKSAQPLPSLSKPSLHSESWTAPKHSEVSYLQSAVQERSPPPENPNERQEAVPTSREPASTSHSSPESFTPS